MVSRRTATPVPVHARSGQETSDLAASVAQALRAIVVFGLLAGLWAYLWLSSSPTL